MIRSGRCLVSSEKEFLESLDASDRLLLAESTHRITGGALRAITSFEMHSLIKPDREGCQQDMPGGALAVCLSWKIGLPALVKCQLHHN
jgi:hypothetical protein